MLSPSVYLASKGITLGTFACLECVIVQTVGFWPAPWRVLAVLPGMAALGVFQCWVGIGLAAPHRSITAFLMPSAVAASLVLELPLLGLIDVGPASLWAAIPTRGPMLLIEAAYRPLALGEWLYALGMSAAACLVAGWWVRRRFRHHVEGEPA